MQRFAVLVAVLFAGACLGPPRQLATGPFAAATVRDAQVGDLAGQRVRWGGTIAAVTTGKDETCFEVVSRPLDVQAHPEATDQSNGRFLACAGGFFDPSIYAEGREITVAGTLGATVPGKIGEHEYRYPRVTADAVYLWPERERVRVYYYPWAYHWGYPWADSFWDPYWSPWPYGRRYYYR